ncbi:MAG TPA: M20/M25/M40 family metallo-hydrolase [bacterium]|nr:M20/M25/M40 family metallo-hydrolase [bacterium]HPR86746.1 M20/M25/M40 family metallo-hydrolase [bacterium]
MNQQKLLDLFLELVRIDAVSLQERPVAEFIKKRLAPLGVEITEDDAAQKLNGTCGNLIIRLPGDLPDTEPLLLLAHLDTVHPTAGVQPVLKEGVLWSDGTTILGVDNRAGVTLLLSLIEELHEHKLHHRSLEIVFTVAEELGMFGAMALDFAQLRAHQGFVFDCTARPGGYVASTPTAYDFKIAITGKSAHSAVAPETGINALSMAVHIMSGFPVGRVNPHSVANFGTIHGGTADNVVPDRVDLTGEFRSFRNEEITALRERLTSLCAEAAARWGGQCEPAFIFSFQGFQFHPEIALVQHLYRAYGRVGVTPQPLVYYGGSDANVFNQHGIQIINTGIGAQNPHSRDEHIRPADLMTGFQILTHLIEAE